MFQLNNLSSSNKKKKRIARGGSRGGTSGKGHKGQRSRSGGKIDLAFEGGQMPLFRRLPKRGFSNVRFKIERLIVTLQQINDTFDDEALITQEALTEKGLIKARKSKTIKRKLIIKILGDGQLTKKVTVVADAFSKSAVMAIENCGGEARLTKEI